MSMNTSEDVSRAGSHNRQTHEKECMVLWALKVLVEGGHSVKRMLLFG